MSGDELSSCRSGVGLRTPHLDEILQVVPAVGFVELHPENYFWYDGPPHVQIDAIRSRYPISFHGVGLSLGSTDALSRPHLLELRRLIERYQPVLVSEHLSWSSIDGRYYNDLLPLPFTEESARHIAERIRCVQDQLGRQILIENISAYVRFEDDSVEEWQFLVEVARRSGCGILLDVNNVYVNARNHGFSANLYVDSVPAELIGQIHLAGHRVEQFEETAVVVDTHSSVVCASVWELYSRVIARCGPRPTLIEWDAEIPALSQLVSEARKADSTMETALESAA